MDTNCLDAGIEDFKKMKSLDRDILMFNNLLHIRTNFIEQKVKADDYKFHKKIQYVWLACLTVFVGIKKFIGFD